MSSRDRLLVAACLLASVTTIGCGVRAQDAPRMADSDSVPFRLLQRDVTTLVPPLGTQTTETVSLCFIDAEHLAVVGQQLDAPASPIAVMRALAEPPTSGSPSLRTAVGPPSLVLDVQVGGGVAQVDLDPALATLGGTNQLLAIGQIVCTLTARPGIGQVAFTIAASPVDVPRGDGSLTANPVSRDDYAELVR
jgi:hypothetical protein